MTIRIEYRVRPITRYVVTRYQSETRETEHGVTVSPADCSTKGEYDNAEVAYEVGYALCKAEHDQLGWPPADKRIQYPNRVPPPSNATARSIPLSASAQPSNTLTQP